jgi:hypothetical protein
LQQAVRKPQQGYELHHIIEQTPARGDDYSDAQIEGPDNLVSIPTLKHWEIASEAKRHGNARGKRDPGIFK